MEGYRPPEWNFAHRYLVHERTYFSKYLTTSICFNFKLVFYNSTAATKLADYTVKGHGHGPILISDLQPAYNICFNFKPKLTLTGVLRSTIYNNNSNSTAATKLAVEGVHKKSTFFV